jgi:ABC-2 type transport system permease protein
MGFLVLLRKALRASLNLRRMAREQSLLKVVVILFFSLCLLAGLGVMFFAGFRFLHSLGGVGVMVIQRLFSLFFFGLALMLVCSSAVASYTTIFRSGEVDDLLTRPVARGQIVLYKAIEASVLASWAFFFMIIPFVGAYALHEGLNALFMLWTFFFSVPFVLLCSALGTMICLALVRWLPRGAILLYLGAAVGAAGFFWLWGLASQVVGDEADATLVLTRLIPGLQISSYPLWPSHWVAEGIVSLGRDQPGRGFLLWAVLASNLLLAGLALERLGERIFYDGWLRSKSSRVAGLRTPWRSTAWLDRLLVFVRIQSRALILKDLRIFLRDPAQWSQMLVFFGLLGLYFLNLRSFRYHLLADAWRNLIAFLNIFSVATVMSSLSARFIYPQMSLEGHSFWFVGLSPVSMRRVLWTKFGLCCAIQVTISLALMGLSTRMLDAEPVLRWIALALAAGIAMAITGLSVGLGAVFLDLRQRNPAAIVSGFGGTLNLVLSMAFTIASVFPMASVFHLRAIGQLPEAMFWKAVTPAVVAFLALTALTSWLPMKLAERSLRRREY